MSEGKIVVTIGYKPYAMSIADGMKLAEILCRAEKYEKKHHREEGDRDSYYTHHVWEQEGDDAFSLAVIPDTLYKMAKLAGKPIKE